jgi:serine/threonine protein kinase
MAPSRLGMAAIADHREQQDDEKQPTRSSNTRSSSGRMLKHIFSLSTADSETLTGGIQDRLKLGKQIGRGAYAFVYKATFDDEVVAVKVLLPEYMEEAGAGMKMFIREGQYLSRSKHKYVGTLYLPPPSCNRHILSSKGFCQIPGNFPGLDPMFSRVPCTWAIVAEFIQGGTLQGLLGRQMIRDHRELYSMHDALRMMHEVALALNYMHTTEPRMVHRDVKQENILLGRDANGQVTVQVADFGLIVVRLFYRSLSQHVCVPQTHVCFAVCNSQTL